MRDGMGSRGQWFGEVRTWLVTLGVCGELRCMIEKQCVEGRDDKTEEAREEGERERMVRRTVTGS